jgi:hypothetical protein
MLGKDKKGFWFWERPTPSIDELKKEFKNEVLAYFTLASLGLFLSCTPVPIGLIISAWACAISYILLALFTKERILTRK